MNYNKLANLLYPDVHVSMYDYINKYPERKLPLGAEVTRIAPSPTGHLHIGHLLSALLNKLVATQSGGIFYFRLEDTDQKRYIKGTENEAYNTLCYFGLTPDEGYRGSVLEQKGVYGNYIQSKRTDIYKAFAKELVMRGRAFPCFCEKSESKQDIIDRREKELEDTDTLEGHDPCRNLSYKQIEENIKANKPWALRLLSKGDPEKSYTYYDAIKGERTIRENSKDIVLVKSDGIPPYVLAHVVDDTLMGTTLVIRGEEWFPSVAAHHEVFDALDLPRIRYAHTPVISKLDEETGGKRKMSKRKDPECNVSFYLEQGYPTESVLEYLLNLLNSDFESWRNQNPKEDMFNFRFSIDRIGSNNPMFDLDKLNNISKNIISRYTAEQVFAEVLVWADNYDKEFYKHLCKNKATWVGMLGIDRGGERPRKDIFAWSMVKDLYKYIYKKQFNATTKPEDRLKTAEAKHFMLEYAQSYNHSLSKEEWFENIKMVAANHNFVSAKEYKANPAAYAGNVADACNLVRLAITGATTSPDLYSIMQLLDATEVVRRITNYANKIKK